MIRALIIAVALVGCTADPPPSTVTLTGKAAAGYTAILNAAGGTSVTRTNGSLSLTLSRDHETAVAPPGSGSNGFCATHCELDGGDWVCWQEGDCGGSTGDGGTGGGGVGVCRYWPCTDQYLCPSVCGYPAARCVFPNTRDCQDGTCLGYCQ